MGTGFLFTDENALSQKRHYIKMYLKKQKVPQLSSVFSGICISHTG
jgi:hypothetical protein